VVEALAVFVLAGRGDAVGRAAALRLALAPVEARHLQFPVLQLGQFAFGEAQQADALQGDDRDPAPLAAAGEIDQRRQRRALAELDAGARVRRRTRPPPMLLATLLGDLDESRFATRRRPMVAVFVAVDDPFGDRPEGDAALVVRVLGRLQQRVEAVAQLGAP